MVALPGRVEVMVPDTLEVTLFPGGRLLSIPRGHLLGPAPTEVVLAWSDDVGWLNPAPEVAGLGMLPWRLLGWTCFCRGPF